MDEKWDDDLTYPELTLALQGLRLTPFDDDDDDDDVQNQNHTLLLIKSLW